MKNLTRLFPLFLFVLAISTFVACEDDDLIVEPAGLTVLQLDGANVSAPLRPEGMNRFGVRFSESRLTDFDGDNLVGVRLFLDRAPQTLEITVHEGGDLAPAGDGERRIAARGTLSTGSFVDYEFIDPLPIDANQPLWLVAEVELAEDQQSVGCDAEGTGVDGGDFIFAPNTGWVTFESLTGVSVNWNIRGLVE